MKWKLGVELKWVAVSPPSRGAWIEIDGQDQGGTEMRSRPPRGGRGLKYLFRYWGLELLPSPPSRGAWIEIDDFCSYGERRDVAPLAGGVD